MVCFPLVQSCFPHSRIAETAVLADQNREKSQVETLSLQAAFEAENCEAELSVRNSMEEISARIGRLVDEVVMHGGDSVTPPFEEIRAVYAKIAQAAVLKCRVCCNKVKLSSCKRCMIHAKFMRIRLLPISPPPIPPPHLTPSSSPPPPPPHLSPLLLPPPPISLPPSLLPSLIPA